MSGSARIRKQIRSNALALVAVFAAVTGTAIASAADDAATAGKSAGTTKQVKKLKQQVAGLQQRLTALEGRGPSGPAGGELAGTYPNPSVGTVNGLHLADSTSPAGGVNFGSDVSIYRANPDVLRTDDLLFVNNTLGVGTNINAGGHVTAGGNLFAGGEVAAGGYLRTRTGSDPPPLGDCDSTTQSGRLYLDFATNILYVCDGHGVTSWLGFNNN